MLQEERVNFKRFFLKIFKLSELQIFGPIYFIRRPQKEKKNFEKSYVLCFTVFPVFNMYSRSRE